MNPIQRATATCRAKKQSERGKRETITSAKRELCCVCEGEREGEEGEEGEEGRHKQQAHTPHSHTLFFFFCLPHFVLSIHTHPTHTGTFFLHPQHPVVSHPHTSHPHSPSLTRLPSGYGRLETLFIARLFFLFLCWTTVGMQGKNVVHGNKLCFGVNNDDRAQQCSVVSTTSLTRCLLLP